MSPRHANSPKKVNPPRAKSLLNPTVIKDLIGRTQPSHDALISHPIYEAANNLTALQVFMGFHVWAVWDFMSLAKRLQLSLTCCNLPWIPPIRPDLARFINEIITDEESDLDHEGKPTSHFQSYLHAMESVGASTEDMQEFIRKIQAGEHWGDILSKMSLPESIKNFVTYNLNLSENGTKAEVAAAFAFGRELILPKLFTRFLSNLDESKKDYPKWIPLRHYLERHIELDGGHHGRYAEQLVSHAVEEEGGHWEKATRAAEKSLENRLLLWDAATERIKKTQELEKMV